MKEKNPGCKYCKWLKTESELVSPKEYAVDFFCTHPLNVLRNDQWYDGGVDDDFDYIDTPQKMNALCDCVFYEPRAVKIINGEQ